MDAIFLDTSAFLKLYLPEKGSSWLRSYVVGKQIFISQLVLFESGNSLARLHRQGTYSKPVATNIYRQLRMDCLKHNVTLLGSQQQLNKVVSTSFNLPTGLRLRTLDAIHIAVAKITYDEITRLTPPVPFTFISADLQLLQVALSQGFTTENPENYP